MATDQKSEQVPSPAARPSPSIAQTGTARAAPTPAAPAPSGTLLTREAGLTEYPGHSEFLLNIPLYAEFSPPDADDLRQLFYNGIKMDGHCPICGRETTFSSANTRSQWSGSPALNDVVTLACARDNTHRLAFWVRTTARSIQKIGQVPSQADIANDQSKTYRAVLSREDAAEFHRAIGLAAHGVGIGSFVYLRRIFERLIWQRFDEFEAAESWDRAEFKKLAMAEKVTFLKDHLPAFLVENARLYSILSLGVHELSEKACLAFFPVLRESTITILDEDKQKKAELDRRERLKKAIQSFEGGQSA